MSACNIGDPTSAPHRTAKPQTESPAVFLYLRLQVVGHRSVAPPHDWSCYQHSTPNRSLQYAFWLAPIRVLGPMTGAATNTRHQMACSNTRSHQRPTGFCQSTSAVGSDASVSQHCMYKHRQLARADRCRSGSCIDISIIFWVSIGVSRRPTDAFLTPCRETTSVTPTLV